MTDLTAKKILVTGGCGFIGSTFLLLMVPRFPRTLFVNFDCLTYAANLANLAQISGLSNYAFERIDLRNFAQLREAFARLQPDWVIHFAAESHVDRSILGPSDFIDTNIVGTFNLLEVCREFWKTSANHLFHHVSTDEVYGSLTAEGYFTEQTPYDPHSPYAASKAASDHLVRAYGHTYGLPAKITNCSNNYGPRQFPEKLIPLMILNCLKHEPLPVYGDGSNVRDWLYVEDHCEALLTVATAGKLGETYNIGGGGPELSNLQVVRSICRMVAEETGDSQAKLESLITLVKDRPGHDQRYAIDASKLRRELGWQPRESFETGLRKTVRWYISNQDWVASIQTGAYRSWLKQNYENR
jgi:dTDP-glucose 4,6-dehydratase